MSALVESAGFCRYVRVPHSQGAAFAAMGYAQASGRTGVCLATTDSNVADLVSPLAIAYSSSTPMVVVVAQSPGTHPIDVGTPDIVGMTESVTKHGYFVDNAGNIPRCLAEAFHVASLGRPGPVLVEIPYGPLTRALEFVWPAEVTVPGYRPSTRPSRKQVVAAASLVSRAQRPVLYVGGGAVSAGAGRDLLSLAEFTGIPVVTTEMARGILPDNHRASYGMVGIDGAESARAAVRACDVLIAIGTTFDRFATETGGVFAEDTKVVQIDIDPSEIGKYFDPAVPIVGDCKAAVRMLDYALRALWDDRRPDFREWIGYLNGTLTARRMNVLQVGDTRMTYGVALDYLGRVIGDDAVFVSNAGPQRAPAVNLPRFQMCRTWLSSGSVRSDLYAPFAAVGARVALPSVDVWLLDDVRSFRLCAHCLDAAVAAGIGLRIALFDLEADIARRDGMSSEGQRATEWAQLLGFTVVTCRSPAEIAAALDAAREAPEEPLLILFALQG
ncbi:hypothetical protein A3K89_17260 [Rhodococcoides kyotonense]|uniref:acetolactate synthase n=1 Tax=Rhodococcoides kyotonense TaxID=398843 RepID=A0A177YKY8_9NOCA|nr:hypothetical protein A3K89_17260 [Rhodococcus kyotonensis]